MTQSYNLTIVMQFEVWPGKYIVRTNFWFVNHGRYLLLIFEKSAPVILGEDFIQAAIFADISKSLKSTYLSNKKSYQEDLPFYGNLWQNKIVLNTFDFNCAFIYADISIFSSAYVSKTLKSPYISTKKLHEEDQPLYGIL